MISLKDLENAIRQEIAATGPSTAIFIETSAAYFVGEDENSNPAMGAYARQLRRFTTMPDHTAISRFIRDTISATQGHSAGSWRSTFKESPETIAAVIVEAGIVNSTFSRIESGETNPFLGALKRILHAIPNWLAEFFSIESERTKKRFIPATPRPIEESFPSFVRWFWSSGSSRSASAARVSQSMLGTNTSQTSPAIIFDTKLGSRRRYQRI